MRPNERKAAQETGFRLRQARYVFGVNGPKTKSKAFAEQLGIAPTAYSNYEKGQRKIHGAAIQILSRLPEITMDWLMTGKKDGVRYGILLQLEAALGEINRDAERRRRAKIKRTARSRDNFA